jgi:hypothetical protein
MMDTQTMVTGTIDTTTLHCDVANFEGPSTPKVWAIMDCVMGKLYGFTTGAANPDGSKQVNMVLASSVFGLLSGFFFGGTWGVVVFFGMISVLVSFFMLLVRTVVTIVNSYLVICLFLILLPLFLPLLLLKATASYFDAVWRNIMAAFLGPVIITAYTMMAIIIYDKLLFDPGDPAATPPRPAAIIQTLFDNAKVKEALAADRKPFSRPVTGEMPTGRISNNPAQNYWVTDPLLPSLSAANDFGSMLPKIPTLHIEDIDDPEYKKGKETIEKLFMDLLKLFILSWLILQGAKWLPSIVAQIVGKRIATMAADKSMEGPEKVKMTLATAADTAENAFRKAGNPTGAGFLRSIPDASKDSLAAFKNMMSKR